MALLDLPNDTLLTTGTIARVAGVERHRVNHFVLKLAIRPEARAGRVRVLSRADAARVLREIERVDAEKAK